jgi:hypothetical protein
VLLACFVTPAAAQTVALMEWDAPEPCPGALSVYQRLSAALGHEPKTLGRLSHVRGSVAGRAGSYQLSLEVSADGRRSSRLIEAASCDDLADVAVLAITLALAPEEAKRPAGNGGAALGVMPRELPTAASHAPPSDAPAADAPTSDAPTATPSASPPETVRADVPARGSASLGVVTELGALPRPAFGVGVSAGAHWQVLSLAAYGMLFGSERIDARPAVGVDFDLTLGGVRGCGRVLSLPLGLDACAGMEAGRWEVFGASLQGARRSRDLWLAPVLGLEASRALTSTLALELGAGAALPLLRKRYVINDGEVVHTPDPVSWRLLAGLTISTR